MDSPVSNCNTFGDGKTGWVQAIPATIEMCLHSTQLARLINAKPSALRHEVLPVPKV
jgi:hypothetical protein